MVTAAPDRSKAPLLPAMLLWLVVGGWAFERLPPDGSAGWVLAFMWAALLLMRGLPWGSGRLSAPRVAGLCCLAPQPRLSDVAMGWMMGTLWWHADGCQGLGLGLAQVHWVVLHMTGMALFVGLTRGLALRLSRSRLKAIAASAAALALLVLMLWPTNAFGMLAVMGILTLTWAIEPVPCSRAAAPTRWLVLVVGPLGLWLILAQWPMHGPAALRLALMLLTTASALIWTIQRLRKAWALAPGSGHGPGQWVLLNTTPRKLGLKADSITH